MMNKIIGGIAILALIVAGFALVGNNNQSGVQSNANQTFGGANTFHITNFDSLATSLGFIQSNGCSDNSDAGLETCVSTGSFSSATTSIIGFVNPFAALATVDYVSLVNTGVATTSYTIACGTSTSAVAATSGSLINSGTVGTSTSFGTFINGISEVYDANATTSAANGTTRIQIAATEYLVCRVSALGGTGYNTAFTDVTSTFAGTYKMRFTR